MSTDKRVIKTKANIRKAFMELSIEKDLGRITVSDLSARALVNRSTFYLHYSDVRSVAEDIDRICAETISSCICKFDITDIYGSAFVMFNRLTEALNTDEPLKKYITESKNSQYVTDKLKNIFVEKTLDEIAAFSPDFDRQAAFYPITFTASGIIDCYIKWTKNGGDVPIDVLIARLSEITEFIIAKIK